MKRDPKARVELKVRMLEPLRAELAEAAYEKGVSMNAEIVSRLEQSFSIGQVIAAYRGGVLVVPVSRMD